MENFEYAQPIKNEAFDKQNAAAIEKWNQEFEEMRQLKSKIIEEADHLQEKGIISARYGSGYFIQNIVVPELEKIAEPDNYKIYAASHLFFGSSTSFDKTPKVDLPDKKIYNFSTNLLKKLHEANEKGSLEI